MLKYIKNELKPKEQNKYMNTLKNAASNEDIEELKDRLDTLSARYSDNPAYNAWMQLKYLEKKAEMKNNATGE